MIDARKDHYDILFQDENGTRYTVFVSTDLTTVGTIFARMLQFEEMFHTFPNASCGLCLERDMNYDPDLGAFRMDSLPFAESGKWAVFVDDIIHLYGSKIDSPERPK